MTSSPLILNIETSTTVCSVNVARGPEVLAGKELDEGYTHAENLHLFIADCLRKAHVKPLDLQAIALSSGPGSYTGLRIGSSTAKGLCLALGIPLISLGTLDVLAHALSLLHSEARHFCPMLDAGRMEVYTAVFDREGKKVMQVQPLVLDEFSISCFAPWPDIVFGGPGAGKARHLLERLPGALFASPLSPSAHHMTSLSGWAYAGGKFTRIADFEPYYLKNFMAGKRKKHVP